MRKVQVPQKTDCNLASESYTEIYHRYTRYFISGLL